MPKTELTFSDLIWLVVFFTLFSSLKIFTNSACDLDRTNRDTAKSDSSLNGLAPLSFFFKLRTRNMQNHWHCHLISNKFYY
jgi:hypothetical protein